MILLRPLLSSLKLRRKEYQTNNTALLRDSSVILLLLVFSMLIFLASRWMLMEIAKDKSILLPPEIPLIFSFNIFFPMIFFAALSGVVSQFFYSEDLELLLASPVSRYSFFFQRFLLVAIETSWMSTISILPFLLAFTTLYHVSILYYMLLPLYLALFIVLPSAFAVLSGIIWALVIPRIPSFIIFSTFIVSAVYLFHELILLLTEYLREAEKFNPDTLLFAMGYLANFGSSWSPATWLAKGLAPFLAIHETSSIINTELLIKFSYSMLAGIALSAILLSLSYMLFIYQYRKALALVWGKQKKVFSFYPERPFNIHMSGLSNGPFRRMSGIMKKEALEFFRDPSQLLQTFFLLSITGLYVYLLRFQQNIYPLIKGINPGTWEKALLGIHLVLECFITVAITTRLLFPAVSREGKAIWIIQKSPVPPKEIVLAKFIFWCIPVMLVLSTLSAISFQLQFGNITITAIKTVLSCTMTSAVSALAIYMGARFSFFSWESRSQLVASFGSLLFMILGLILSGFTVLFSIPLFQHLSNDTTGRNHLILFCLIAFTNVAISIFLLKKAGIILTKKLLHFEL